MDLLDWRRITSLPSTTTRYLRVWTPSISTTGGTFWRAVVDSRHVSLVVLSRCGIESLHWNDVKALEVGHGLLGM